MRNKKFLLPCITILFASILNINVFAHQHTDDCYAGTAHTCDGNETTYGLCYTKPTYHTHKKECYSTECKAVETESIKTTLESVCNICGEKYVEEKMSCKHCGAVSANYFYCSIEACENYKKDTINITHTALTGDNIEKYGELVCNKTENTIDAYEKTCDKENGAYYYGSEKVEPICNKVVVSIKPVSETQTTKTPNFKLLATYLDGHTAEIEPTSTSYLSNMTYNNAQIQLNYYGLCKNANSYGNLNTFINLTTPTEIPTPTATPTPTSTPTPTEIVTPTPTATPTPTIKPTIETTPEPTIENPYVTNTVTPTPTTFIIEGVEIEEEKDNDGLVIFLVILIVVLLIGFSILNVYLLKNNDNETDDDDFDDDYDDYDDYDNDNDYDNNGTSNNAQNWNQNVNTNQNSTNHQQFSQEQQTLFTETYLQCEEQIANNVREMMSVEDRKNNI